MTNEQIDDAIYDELKLKAALKVELKQLLDQLVDQMEEAEAWRVLFTLVLPEPARSKFQEFLEMSPAERLAVLRPKPPTN